MGVICVQPLIREADIKHLSDKEQHGLFSHGEYVTNNDDIKLINLFKDITHHISSLLPNDPPLIECVVLELVLSHALAHISLRKDEYKPYDGLNFITLNMDAEDVDTLEKKFFELHKRIQKFTQIWNKARFFLTPNNSDYFFEYKFDSDLFWAQSIDPESMEYQNLSPDIENKIMNWEGLSTDYFKSWIN